MRTARCPSRLMRPWSGGSFSSPPIRTSAYAARYRALVEKVQGRQKVEKAPGQCGLAEAVARYLFKLMAYKDEYEVARLYTDGNFLKQVANELGGDNLRFEFHLAPPLLARPDPATGEPRKISFGPWLMSAFKLLARLKFLRGTPFDVFGYSDERKTERRLLADYEVMLDEVLANLTPANHPLAVGLAAIPETSGRLGAGQGPPPRRCQGRRGGAAGAVPFRPAAGAEGCGVALDVYYCVTVMLLARMTSPQSLISLLSNVLAASGSPVQAETDPCRLRQRSF